MPPAGYPAFLQYLQSGRVRFFHSVLVRNPAEPAISLMPFVRRQHQWHSQGLSVAPQGLSLQRRRQPWTQM